MSRVLALPLILLILCVLPACWGRESSELTLPESPPGPPLVYVAIGASETVGIGARDPLREAWPQVFYRTALPRNARYVNLGIPGATVADALRSEVPHALRVGPELVTVWLNVNDILAGVSPAAYERDLAQLIRRLRRGGVAKVLVANTPPLDRLPAFVACQPEAGDGDQCRFEGSVPYIRNINEMVDAYNEIIQRVSAREGAVVVDLHAAGLAVREAGTEMQMVSDDGFHPSTLGHRAVADAFAATFHRS